MTGYYHSYPFPGFNEHLYYPVSQSSVAVNTVSGISFTGASGFTITGGEFYHGKAVSKNIHYRPQEENHRYDNRSYCTFETLPWIGRANEHNTQIITLENRNPKETLPCTTNMLTLPGIDQLFPRGNGARLDSRDIRSTLPSRTCRLLKGVKPHDNARENIGAREGNHGSKLRIGNTSPSSMLPAI